MADISRGTLYARAVAAGDMEAARWVLTAALRKGITGDPRIGRIDQACPSCWKAQEACWCDPPFVRDDAQMLEALGFSSLCAPHEIIRSGYGQYD